MSGCRLPSRCPTLLEKVPIQDGDTASFYVDDLTEEADNNPLPDIGIAPAVRNMALRDRAGFAGRR